MWKGFGFYGFRILAVFYSRGFDTEFMTVLTRAYVGHPLGPRHLHDMDQLGHLRIEEIMRPVQERKPGFAHTRAQVNSLQTRARKVTLQM